MDHSTISDMTIDVVRKDIVHEMLHLLERHHNDRFLAYLETYLPNWKQLKAELNTFPVSHAD